MAEIGFYHLTRSPLDAVLPTLLEKILAIGLRALVLAGSPERVEHLNQILWTGDPASFLPHGSDLDGQPELQPIWLSHRPDNVNGAQALVLCDGTGLSDLSGFVRCLDIFDGLDETAVAAARDRYRQARAAGHSLKYFRQVERGWELAASQG